MFYNIWSFRFLSSATLAIASMQFTLLPAPVVAAPATAAQQQALLPVITPLFQKIQAGTVTQNDINLAKARVATITSQSTATTGTDTTPLGAITSFAKMSCPINWLETNGQTFPLFLNGSLDLDGAILLIETGGVLKVMQQGANIFLVLPDLRGQFIRGWNNTATGKDPGRQIGSLQIQQQANSIGIPNVAGQGGEHLMGNGTRRFLLHGVSGQSSTFTPQPNVDIRPSNIALLYCIKVK